MIPYFSFTSFSLGPVTLHVWGILVALGFLFGGYMAAWFAQRRKLDVSLVWDLLFWFVLAGLIGGRLGHVLFYEPQYYFLHPFEVFEIWQGGLSWFGGMIASIGVGIFILRRRGANILAYADVFTFGLPFGKWIGRLGCFVIHDHPGAETNFFLGVQYPDGMIRHDLGLDLSISAFFLSLLMLVLVRKERSQGIYVAVFTLWYGISRFLLDFLRITDVRYFGLTPGQYCGIVLVLFGIAMAVWIRKRSKKA